MITILESNTTTIICMLVLYFAGEGPVSDFAFMVLLSVSWHCVPQGLPAALRACHLARLPTVHLLAYYPPVSPGCQYAHL